MRYSYFGTRFLIMISTFSLYHQWDMRSSARKFRKDAQDAIKTIRDTGREAISKRIEDIGAMKEVPEDTLTYIIKAGQEMEGSDEEKMAVMVDHFATFFVAGEGSFVRGQRAS